MRRALVLAAATTLAALTVPSPAGAVDRPPGDDDVPDASASPGGPPCVEPRPSLVYGSESLSYGVAVDYSGCDWWDGGPIQLSATVEHFDGVNDGGVGTGVVCGVPSFVADEDEALGGDRFEAAGRTCSVSAEMEHPPAEVARYRGEVSWPWADGTRTASFELFCVATPLGGHCEELPAVPVDHLGSDLLNAAVISTGIGADRRPRSATMPVVRSANGAGSRT